MTAVTLPADRGGLRHDDPPTPLQPGVASLGLTGTSVSEDGVVIAAKVVVQQVLVADLNLLLAADGGATLPAALRPP